MARNALQRFAEARSWNRAQEWNNLAQEIRPLIISFLKGSLSKSRVPENLRANLMDDLCWDIMGICFEEEYRDVVLPLFYIPHLEPWYALGHFPCGWDGEEFPVGWDGVIRNGHLIVY